MSDVTQLLDLISEGNGDATNDLLPLVYHELRRLAGQKMAREEPGQTLQATALVHEGYLRLVKEDRRSWANRKQFFAAAAEAMRRILVERARRKNRVKHGGALDRVSFDEVDLVCSLASDQILAVDEAIESLQEEDPRAAEIVKLRYFSGLTQSEIAQCVKLSERRVNDIWRFARVWLYNRLNPS